MESIPQKTLIPLNKQCEKCKIIEFPLVTINKKGKIPYAIIFPTRPKLTATIHQWKFSIRQMYCRYFLYLSTAWHLWWCLACVRNKIIEIKDKENIINICLSRLVLF